MAKLKLLPTAFAWHGRWVSDWVVRVFRVGGWIKPNNGYVIDDDLRQAMDQLGTGTLRIRNVHLELVFDCG